MIRLNEFTNHSPIQGFHFNLQKLQVLSENENQNGSFVAHSDSMKQIIKLAQRLAKSDSTILIHGETGVGKEVIANYIYQSGTRKGKPFIKVNCGAIPENLLESELFGYVKGAFTGAAPEGKKGYFELANQGVIVLDEIGELPLNLQVKLLRVIQEREVIPLGGREPVKIDVQIISCTNKNLEKLVKEGLFREDLYYRLNVVPIYIPPLRNRVSDIPHLVCHFTNKLKRKYHRNVSFSADALELMKTYPWYGNVRELENIVERIFVTSETDIVDASLVSEYLPYKAESESNIIIKDIVPLQEAIDKVEEQLILMAINQYKTITSAAKALGISQPSMSRKYKEIRKKREPRITQLQGNVNCILEKELDKHLRSVSIVLAASINLEDLKQLLNHISAENPAYHKLQDHLTRIREEEREIVWSFIWKVTKDGKVINLVTDKNLDMKPQEEYIAPKEMRHAINTALGGRTAVTPIYRDVYGKWKSSISPIKDEDGKIIAILGADFSAEYVDEQIEKLKNYFKNHF